MPGIQDELQTTRPKDNSDKTTRPIKISDQDNSAHIF